MSLSLLALSYSTMGYSFLTPTSSRPASLQQLSEHILPSVPTEIFVLDIGYVPLELDLRDFLGSSLYVTRTSVHGPPTMKDFQLYL